MKRLSFFITIVLVLFLSINLAFAGDKKNKLRTKKTIIQNQEFAPGEVVVRFKDGVDDYTIEQINKKFNSRTIKKSKFKGTRRINIPKGKTIEETIARYTRNPNVLYAEPNYIAYASNWVPNDELYSYQWNLQNHDAGINMESAWVNSPAGYGVTVAVIDTGIAYEDYGNYMTAPDLANAHFVAGYDFVNDDSHPNDDEGHGTHVAGTIAQNTNNVTGVAGIAFDASLMPVKVLDNNGSGYYTDIADGIYYAISNGANVINMSLGGSKGSVTLKNAVKAAHEAGIVIVCSSGNDGSPRKLNYPAAYDDYCIAVGATRFDGEVAYYSNCGSSLDVVAPGGDINVDQNGDGYGDGILQQTFGDTYSDFGYYFYQGTSMAAPHVTGIAALIISENVANTPHEVRNVIQSTARDMGNSGWDKKYGWGLVDAYAAINYAGETPPDDPVTDYTMHVSNITISAKIAGKNINVKASTIINDGNNNPVDGVTVNGSWSGPVSNDVTGITGSNGEVVFNLNKLKNVSGEIIFTVTNLYKSGFEYKDPENIETSDSIVL